MKAGLPPTLQALSQNPCPNAGTDWITGEDCSSPEASMTVWGYCTRCWTEGRVPPAWRARVTDAMTNEGVSHT